MFSLRVLISAARFSSKVNLSLISWLNCAIKPKKSVTLKNNDVSNARTMHYEIGL